METPHRKMHKTKMYPVTSRAPPLQACTQGQMEKAASWSAIVSASSTLTQTPLGQYAPSFRDTNPLCCPGYIIYYSDLGIREGSSVNMMSVVESYSCPCTFPYAKCPVPCLAGSVHSPVFCWYLCGPLNLSEFLSSSLVHLGLGIGVWSLTLCFLSPNLGPPALGPLSYGP